MRLAHRILTPTLAAAAALAMALSSGVAGAQVRHRPVRMGQRPPAQAVHVSGFAPSTGPIGTRVTIRGQGFTPATSIRIGGRAVRIESRRWDAITFSVPANLRNGTIMLRNPGRPAITVGTFAVRTDPTITRVRPGAHRAGGQIVVHGRGFAPGDALLLNGLSLPIVQLAASRIVATIPAGATAGRLVLYRASTRQRFESGVLVRVAAPARITAMHPSAGTPGTRVRLAVTGLSSDDRIYYGNVLVPTVASGRGWVEVTVPAGARSSARFSVRGPAGSSRFTELFQLRSPARIASMSARPVTNGIELTILGSGFGQDARVTVGHVHARVLSRSPTRIVALVPMTSPANVPAVVHTGGRQLSTADAVWRPAYAAAPCPTLRA